MQQMATKHTKANIDNTHKTRTQKASYNIPKQPPIDKGVL